MKLKTLLILIPFLPFCFSSCKKSTVDVSNFIATSDSYLPVSSGTTWTYNVSGVTGTTVIKMTGSTTVINGKTYFNATSTSSQGSSPGYIYASNHLYATRGSNAAAGITAELQLFNDTAKVGYSWISSPSDNGSFNGYPVRTINTIKEINITKTVGSKTFTNVMHTFIDLQYDYGTGFQSFITYDYYLAKGVGIIEDDAYSFGASAGSQTLVDFTIK
jgi:hypothetical protein